MSTFLVFAAALLISLFTTPYVKRLALYVGAVDKPDKRRVHLRPTLGGLAIYLAVYVAILPHVRWDDSMVGLFIGSTLILVTGVVDDIKGLRPVVKLISQVAAALILVHFGFRIEWIQNPISGAFIYLDGLSLVVTLLWIVGLTNALNFIDGLDGLAAGVSAITCMTLFIISVSMGNAEVIILTAALAGGAIGFLRWNFNPAQIFMGDTGSMFLGFMLAAVSVQGLMKSAAVVALSVPVLALGLPILDTTFVVLRRILDGRPISEADRSHIHYQLLAAGYSHRQTVLLLYSLSACFGAAAVAITHLNRLQSSYVLVALGIIVYMVMRRLVTQEMPADRSFHSSS